MYNNNNKKFAAWLSMMHYALMKLPSMNYLEGKEKGLVQYGSNFRKNKRNDKRNKKYKRHNR